MTAKSRIISILLFTITTAITASAQSGRVSLRPVLKPGQENRYVFNATVDTRVTPAGSNGIASSVHRETVATCFAELPRRAIRLMKRSSKPLPLA
jgi:hypothetical protein